MPYVIVSDTKLSVEKGGTYHCYRADFHRVVDTGLGSDAREVRERQPDVVVSEEVVLHSRYNRKLEPVIGVKDADLDRDLLLAVAVEEHEARLARRRFEHPAAKLIRMLVGDVVGREDVDAAFRKWSIKQGRKAKHGIREVLDKPPGLRAVVPAERRYGQVVLAAQLKIRAYDADEVPRLDERAAGGVDVQAWPLWRKLDGPAK